MIRKSLNFIFSFTGIPTLNRGNPLGFIYLWSYLTIPGFLYSWKIRFDYGVISIGMIFLFGGMDLLIAKWRFEFDFVKKYGAIILCFVAITTFLFVLVPIAHRFH